MKEISKTVISAWSRFQKALARKNLSVSTIEAEADSMLIKVTTLVMGEKLQKSREKGRYGWWNSTCSTNELKEMLREHVDKGDMSDVINLAAMIHFREAVDIEKPVTQK